MIQIGSMVFPHSSTFIISGLVLFLFFMAFLIILTLSRPNKNHLKLRLVMNSLASLSLFLMVLQPQWKSTAKQAGAVLITPGAKISQLDSLSKEQEWSYLFSMVNDKKWKLNYPAILQIPDVGYLDRYFPEVKRLHVVGHGLLEYDWNELKNLEVIPHFTNTTSGIQQVEWPGEIPLGQSLSVNGILTGLISKSKWLYLAGPEGVVDSIALNFSKGKSVFTLQAKPKDTGKHLYKIFTKQKYNPLIEEEIPVIVVKPNPLKILVLQSSPKFETKYLKSWLAEQGYSIVIRSGISKERFRYDIVNHKKLKLQRINSTILNDFDLTLVDGNTLDALSTTEANQLYTAVENGLGLLLMPDDLILESKNPQLSRSAFLSKFRFKEFEDLDIRFVKPKLAKYQPDHFSDISSEPFEIENQFGLIPMVKDRMDRWLSARVYSGEGKVGISLVKSTYHWLLSGKKDHYSDYWSYMLTSLSRRDDRSDTWILPSNLPLLKNQPIQIKLLTKNMNPIGSVTSEDNPKDKIHLKQDLFEKSLWTGTYWPKKAGWHFVSTSSEKGSWFYVNEDNAWLSRRQGQKINETRLRSTFNPRIDETQDVTNSKKTQAISSVWFFLVFLLSTSYLWIERKI